MTAPQSPPSPPPIRALLLDLDGVLYIGDRAIEGAADAVRRLHAAGFAMAGITNTTTQPRQAVRDKLTRLGIDPGALFTPAALACRAIGTASAKLYVRDALKADFAGVTIAEHHPDYIVMGDLGGAGYTPELLRAIFLDVMAGARLLALHKNRFWQKPDGLHLDIGPFVAAVEYATGREAIVLGKPSAGCFHGACEALGVRPEETLMVGDDVESDIGGAQQAGLRAALVQTGKYRAELVARSGITPELLIPSIAELPDMIGRL